MAAKNTKAGTPVPILGGYFPLSVLWQGVGEAPPLFRSEGAAKWFIRIHRQEIVQAKALARFGGQAYVHLSRFEPLLERIALEAAC
jgi:hypothetical protein